ncbi:MAG: hypothetical protein IPK78_03635 [Rhodospirillales bacterium]|nr:hypothetical protein [Rhodospirillales bacterium]
MRGSVAAIVCILSFTVASCTSNRINLTETGAVDVKIDDGPGSHVKYVNVYIDTDDNEIVIRGKLYGTGVPFFPRYGKHVHVTVMSPDDQVIAEESPRVIWRTRSKSRYATGSFTVRLPAPVPTGTVVDVVYHDAFHRNVSPGPA